MALVSFGLVGNPGIAVATGNHVLSGTFGSATSIPADPEPLSSPTGVAFNESNDEVYVTDTGHNRVEHFTAAGQYVGQFAGEEATAGPLSSPEGIAIDNDPASPSYGDVYVVDTDHHVADKFSAAGAYLGALTESEGAAGGIAGVATDSSGDVWLYANNGQAVEFTDEGQYVPGSSFNTEKGVSPGLAVDSAGGLYIITAAHNLRRSTAINPQGTLVGLETETVTGAATGVSDEVYVDQGTAVQTYGPPSYETTREEFGSGQLAGGAGLAVSQIAGVVYVAEPTNNTIAIFGPPPSTAPSVSGESYSHITATTTLVQGEVDPDGLESHCRTEYVSEVPYATSGFVSAASVPCAPASIPVGNGIAVVSANLAGLVPGTLYHFRIQAENARGPTNGADEAFLTAPALPTTGIASAANQTEATVTGSFTPNGHGTRYFFEYGPSPCAPTACGERSVEGASSSDGVVSPTVRLSGLTPGTTYHYRLAVSNGSADGGGTTYGPEREFVSLPLAAYVTTDPPFNVGANAATVGAEILDQGAEGIFDVEFGTSEALGETTSPVNLAASTTGRYVNVRLDALAPLTTYFYRFAAYNLGGEGRGDIATFTTSVGREPSQEMPVGFSLTGSATPQLVTAANSPTLNGLRPIPASTVRRLVSKVSACSAKASKFAKARKRQAALKKCKTRKAGGKHSK